MLFLSRVCCLGEEDSNSWELEQLGSWSHCVVSLHSPSSSMVAQNSWISYMAAQGSQCGCREPEGRCITFYHLALEFTQHHFYKYLLEVSHKSQPTFKGRGIRFHLSMRVLSENLEACFQTATTLFRPLLETPSRTPSRTQAGVNHFLPTFPPLIGQTALSSSQRDLVSGLGQWLMVPSLCADDAKKTPPQEWPMSWLRSHSIP